MAATSTTKKPHAVLFPLPASQGHMNPMTQLAKALASSGVLVTLVTVNYKLSSILQTRQNSGLLMHPNIRFSGIPDSFLVECDRGLPRSRFEAIEQLEGPMEELLHKLLAEHPPITCLIDDCFVSWTPDVANRLNIPRIAFWPQSAAIFAIYTHHEQIISAIGHDPLESTAQKMPNGAVKLITCIPGVPPLHPAYLPYTLPNEQTLPYVRKFLRKFPAHVNDTVCVIGNTFDELEPQLCKSLPKFYAIGPLIPSVVLQDVDQNDDTRTGSSFWDEDDCSEWLDMQRPSSVVYVSFGSATKFSVAQTQEIARGLKASQQPFLWVIRPDSIRERVRDITDALPGGFLDEIEGQGKVIRWAAQAMVLSSGAVGGFFSHCGWNSTMESISAGVPLLGWPGITDQATNCWMVAEEWGVGLELKRMEALEVERAVRRLMVGEEAHIMQQRACKLKEAARRAHGRHGSSHNHLSSLLHHLFR